MSFKPYVRLAANLTSTVRNWPLYITNRLLKLKTETITYELRNGMKMMSRPFAIDRAAFNDVWFDESYDPNRFGLPFDWESCRTIVDIGANIGNFTVFAAWKAPQARILAIEPAPESAQMVRRNVEVNALGNRVIVHQGAIAAQEGSSTLYLSQKDSGGHSLYDHEHNSIGIEVSMTTLASLFATHEIQHCDFLKIDCEGAEYDILFSLSPELLSRINFLAIETHPFSHDPRHTPHALSKFLSDQGFTVVSPKKAILFAHR